MVCLCHALLLIIIHCELLAGEFSELCSYFYTKPPCLTHFVGFLCCALLLISMHCGLQQSRWVQWIVRSQIKPFCLLVHFVVCLCHALVLMPYSGAYCGLLGCEFSEILYFLNWLLLKALFIFWFVFAILFLLVSMHRELLGCEFSGLFIS